MKINKNKIIGISLFCMPFILIFIFLITVSGFWHALRAMLFSLVVSAAFVGLIGLIGGGVRFLMKEDKADTPEDSEDDTND